MREQVPLRIYACGHRISAAAAAKAAAAATTHASRDAGINLGMRRAGVAWRWRALLLCASAIAALEPALATDNVEVECSPWAAADRQGKAKWVEGQG